MKFWPQKIEPPDRDQEPEEWLDWKLEEVQAKVRKFLEPYRGKDVTEYETSELVQETKDLLARELGNELARHVRVRHNEMTREFDLVHSDQRRDPRLRELLKPVSKALAFKKAKP